MNNQTIFNIFSKEYPDVANKLLKHCDEMNITLDYFMDNIALLNLVTNRKTQPMVTQCIHLFYGYINEYNGVYDKKGTP